MMIVTSETFWRAVRSRWNPRSEVELYAVTRAVLRQLRQRLPGAEALKVFSALPPEISRLSAAPGVEQLEREGRRRIVDVDAPGFYDAVAHDSGVQPIDAEDATPAVFHALQEVLPEDARARIPGELPPRLAQVWRRA